MPLEFESLSATALKSLSASQTVFFFPVAPLEDHGPHLPMGLDLIEARKLCRLAAEKLEKDLPGWTGVIMPSAPLGIEANTTRLALTVRSYVLRDWLIDACRALKKSGFCHFVCFSGHLGPKQLTAIEDAARIISRRPLLSAVLPRDPRITPWVTLVSACSPLTSLQDMKKSPLWPDPAEHGGERDTSVALAICPELTQGNASLPQNPRPESKLIRTLKRIRRQTQDYWGAPALADPLKGNRILQGSIDEIFPKLRAVWEGSHPNYLFRSWYSILPPNKSFLKGWILALLILTMIWAYLGLMGMGNPPS